jgi:hypothetical protein
MRRGSNASGVRQMTFQSFRRPAPALKLAETCLTTEKPNLALSTTVCDLASVTSPDTSLIIMGPPPTKVLENPPVRTLENPPFGTGGLGHAPFSASGPQSTRGPVHFDSPCISETSNYRKRALPAPQSGPPVKRITKFPSLCGRLPSKPPEDIIVPLPLSLTEKITNHLVQKEQEFHHKLTALQGKHSDVTQQLEQYRGLAENVQWESEYGADTSLEGAIGVEVLPGWKLEKKVNCLALRQQKLLRKIQLLTDPETEALLSTQLTIYHRRYEQESTNAMRNEIMNDFVGRFGNGDIPVSHYNIMECQTCHISMHVTIQTGFLQCAQCLQTIPYNEWLPYSASGGVIAADDTDVCNYSSKKLVGFQEFLWAVQGKKVVPLLEAEIPRLRSYLLAKGSMCHVDSRGVSPGEGGLFVSGQDIFDMLTDLNKRKFQKYGALLEYRIKMLPPLQLTLQQESRFKAMLSTLIEPYLKHKPPERCHFLSYAYCGWQFCRIEGLHQLYGLFRLLKDPAKVRVQDTTFKAICLETGWHYASPLDFPELFVLNGV